MIKSTNIALLVLYLFTLIFTVFIFFKYTVPLKRDKPQICSFYILSMVNQALCIAIYIYFIVIGVSKLTKVINTNILVLMGFAISRTISSTIFCLITLTMYQLYLGLAYVNKKYKSMDVVRQKKSCALIWFAIIFILNVLFLVPLCVRDPFA